MVGLGFIGAGNHACHHMKEFARLPQARLVSVFDIVTASADEAAQNFPPLRAVASVEALLSDPNLDAVVIATPAETHRSLTEAALAAGKHVLLEKPMAHTPEDARAIVVAGEAHPELTLLVGHCERFNSAYLDVKKAVDSGHIGTPRFASATRLTFLADYGWKLGVLDTAVHDIDIMLWVIGARPISIAASGTIANKDAPIPDQVIYQMQFDNGALAQGHIGWFPFSGGYPMQKNAHPRLFLAGTDGIISLDLWHRPVAVHSTTTGAYFWPDDVLVGYADYFTEVTAQDYAFLRAVSDKIPLPIRPHDAYMATRLAHAALESLQAGGGVVIALPQDVPGEGNAPQ